jgi:Gly-Xaa carboxypeptidase
MFRPHIKAESPVWGYLNCIAAHGEKGLVPKWIRDAVASSSPDFDSIAENFAETSPSNRYLVQTSKVATIFNAGLKVSDPVSMPLINRSLLRGL